MTVDTKIRDSLTRDAMRIGARCVRSTLWFASVCGVLVLISSVHGSAAVQIDVATTSTLERTPARLPAEFRLPPSDCNLTLVSIVLSDLDADGDLDVVALIRPLAVAVWLNDGTGNLTRREPSPSNGVSRQPGDSGLHNRSLGEDVAQDQQQIPTAHLRERLQQTIADSATLPLRVHAPRRHESLTPDAPRPPPGLSFLL